MKKYVLGFVATAILLLMSINAYAVDIGLGVEEDDGDMEIDFSVDWNKEVGPWQTNIEFDHVIEESDGEQEENLTYLNVKQNYQFSDRMYVLGLVQFDSDRFRPGYETRTVLGGGVGYKIFKSERIKISNEFSIAYLDANSSEAIFRNSLWASYKIADKLSATNKLLYESGNDSYMRNEFEINYELADNISVGLSWRKIDEGFQTRDTKSLNFGFKF